MGETSSCVAKINIQKRKMCLKFQHLLLRGKRWTPHIKPHPVGLGQNKERIICCMHVYTSETASNKATVLKSILDTVKSKFKTDSW